MKRWRVSWRKEDTIPNVETAKRRIKFYKVAKHDRL
jgi:hypothetical protein